MTSPAGGPNGLLEAIRAALSHELGQPLAVARGYLELLELRTDDSMRRTAPARIREAIERAGLLASDLSLLIELETGTEVEAVSGARALAAARERVGLLAGARDVAVADEGEPPATDVPALGALLAAGVERAERGSTVRVRALDDGVEIAWEGEAIAPAVADRIGAASWAGDSASLGCYLARRRLEVLGAVLVVEPRRLAIRT